MNAVADLDTKIRGSIRRLVRKGEKFGIDYYG